jgi:hypothetical protein
MRAALEACVAQLLTAGEIDEADVAALVAACGCERVGEFADERRAQQLLFATPPEVGGAVRAETELGSGESAGEADGPAPLAELVERRLRHLFLRES